MMRWAGLRSTGGVPLAAAAALHGSSSCCASCPDAAKTAVAGTVRGSSCQRMLCSQLLPCTAPAAAAAAL
jgi:hypothetical protein